MDHDGDLADVQTEKLGGLSVVDFIDCLYLNEMIAGPKCTALALAALISARTDTVRVGIG